jgi:phosphoglycerate dehydrogenase-like enzyme
MNNKTSILVIDTLHPLLLQLLNDAGFEITEAYDWSKEKICKEIQHFKGIIIRSRITIDKTIIDAASQLQFIARYCSRGEGRFGRKSGGRPSRTSSTVPSDRYCGRQSPRDD